MTFNFALDLDSFSLWNDSGLNFQVLIDSHDNKKKRKKKKKEKDILAIWVQVGLQYYEVAVNSNKLVA